MGRLRKELGKRSLTVGERLSRKRRQILMEAGKSSGLLEVGEQK